MLPIAEKMLNDADEMRAFYASIGLSEVTTERAIKARFNPPEPDAELAPPRGKSAKRRDRPRR